MGVSFARLEKPQENGISAESRKAVLETEHLHPHANLMAVRGSGIGKDTMFITFYKNYAAYADAMLLAKQIPHVSINSVESFLVEAQRQKQLQDSEHVDNIPSHFSRKR